MKLKSTLRDLSALIFDDDFAAGFQSMVKYRKALNDEVWRLLRVVIEQESELSNAKVAKSRRLTWRERISGRLEG